MDVISLNIAREQGLKFYFTGKPCKRGHVSNRLVSGRSCIECQLTNSKDWYKDNKNRNLKNGQNWRKSNKNRARAIGRKSCKIWRDNNKALNRAYSAKYYISKTQAIPSWYEFEKSLIEDIYIKRKELSDLTDTVYHVDHIIPLNHPLVCGLHTINNLQIITATENMIKNNKYKIE